MQFLEKIIGHRLYRKLVQIIKYLRDKFYINNNNRLISDNKSMNIKIYEQKNRHVFFGYYDIQQLNEKETKMLVHVVKKKANTKRDLAEIGYYDLTTNEYIPIGTTHTWSWQQGARLRWWPNDENFIAFNDYENGKYVCKKVNIHTKKIENVFCRALYDIDSTASYGLSLNFSRLQRLRPGYGYNYLTDNTQYDNSPKNDGIFYVDLENNKSYLLISLDTLAKTCNDKDALQHYINHISISPDNKRFMFFHIYTLKNSNRWKTQLCIMDKSGKNFKILESINQVSHYDWIDSNNILITGYTPERKQRYTIYDIEKETKKILNYNFLDKDGHPTVLNDKFKFISDTYPKKNDMQTLFECNMKEKKYLQLLKIYSSPLMYEEKRCDLHPRISKTEKIITMDSTFSNNCRKIILLENWRKK